MGSKPAEYPTQFSIVLCTWVPYHMISHVINNELTKNQFIQIMNQTIWYSKIACELVIGKRTNWSSLICFCYYLMRECVWLTCAQSQVYFVCSFWGDYIGLHVAFVCLQWHKVAWRNFNILHEWLPKSYHMWQLHIGTFSGFLPLHMFALSIWNCTN